MTTIASKQRANSEMPWLIGFAVLAVLGIVVWILQLTQGFGILGVNQTISWGAYVAAFFVLAGAGSGLVILAAAADLDALPALKGQRRPLLIAALACLIGAGFMILMDIGHPERILGFFASPNFGSMHVWDFYTLALTVVLVLVYLYLGPIAKWFLWLAALVAAVVVVVEGWMLAASAANVLWHSAIVPVIFLVEALIVAVSLIILAKGKADGLGRLLAALLGIALALTLIEFYTISHAGDPDMVEGVEILLGGGMGLMYWGQILLGIALPLVLLVWMANNNMAIQAAAILAILGVFVAKLVLLVAGQAEPFMGPVASYMPSLVEFAGILGILGLVGLVFLLVSRYLPSKA